MLPCMAITHWWSIMKHNSFRLMSHSFFSLNTSYLIRFIIQESCSIGPSGPSAIFCTESKLCGHCFPWLLKLKAMALSYDSCIWKLQSFISFFFSLSFRKRQTFVSSTKAENWVSQTCLDSTDDRSLCQKVGAITTFALGFLHYC